MAVIEDEPSLFRRRRQQDAFRTGESAAQTDLREEFRGIGDRRLPGMIANLEALRPRVSVLNGR